MSGQLPQKSARLPVLETPRPDTLRSDARDNRERILAVARTAFGADGLGVPMREIARRAEVGPATLYRRFPTKEALVIEAFAEQMALCTSIVEDGLSDPDPWHGFCTVVERVCELHAGNQGFTAAFMAAFPHAIDFTTTREQTLRAVGELARRAKAAGHLRSDFVISDLLLVLQANSGVRAESPADALLAARRFAALQIQGFRASPGAPPLPPPARLPLLPVG
ncbi:TetR/AcrR family transcriptional regulator [Actinoplanes palleronii]|uniref:TetR/AcrR family transcriptional regulator n=1 Tax=Actinoplanes palleronii TaxID=113570 RepID=UPI001EF26820|nr:TetR/AcrR family transcriptional regulator [Actinoplanes palleronii]